MTLYDATKSATEPMGHFYAHLFGTPATLFRFFTVYGPWGVPGTAPPVDGDALSPVAPFRLVSIGGGKPSPLMDYIAELERALGQTAEKQFLPMQDGDVPNTTASPDLLERLIGYKPETPISIGVPAFVGWFRQRYNL